MYVLYINVCTHVYIYMCTYAHMYTHIYTSHYTHLIFVASYYECVHIYIYIYIYIHVYVYIYIHMVVGRYLLCGYLEVGAIVRLYAV